MKITILVGPLFAYVPNQNGNFYTKVCSCPTRTLYSMTLYANEKKYE